MLFPVKDTLTPAERERGLASSIKDGVCSQAMGTLTGGTLLAGFALELGASNAMVGLLLALPSLMQLLQFPAVLIVERVRVRRAVTVVGAGLSRLLLVPMAALPLIASNEVTLAALAVGAVLAGIFSAVATCGWNSWIRDLVPQDRLGGFFARRQLLATAAAMALGVGGGAFLDAWNASFPEAREAAYSVLFLVGLVFGVASTWYLYRTPETPLASPPPGDTLRLPLDPFRDGDYRRLLVFLGL